MRTNAKMIGLAAVGIALAAPLWAQAPSRAPVERLSSVSLDQSYAEAAPGREEAHDSAARNFDNNAMAQASEPGPLGFLKRGGEAKSPLLSESPSTLNWVGLAAGAAAGGLIGFYFLGGPVGGAIGAGIGGAAGFLAPNNPVMGGAILAGAAGGFVIGSLVAPSGVLAGTLIGGIAGGCLAGPVGAALGGIGGGMMGAAAGAVVGGGAAWLARDYLNIA